jgi:hypothetical protein
MTRRVSVMVGTAGMTLVVLGVALRAPIPFSLWGMMAVVAAVIAYRSGTRRSELWIYGTEMAAEARPAKSWILTWGVGGRTYSEQTCQQPLLWTNGRVRILVDLDHPSRMTPVGMEMVAPPEPVGSQEAWPPVLPPRLRAPNARMLKGARQRRIAAAVTAALALCVAAVVAPSVLERRRFLSEASSAGPARVIGHTRNTVDYECEGARRSFAAGGKAQSRWPIGKIVPVYRVEGFIVAEPEFPGLPLATGLILTCLPAAAAIGFLVSAIREARFVRRLWRQGKEVPAEILSDHTLQGQREVICRFASAGSVGTTRRAFSASRRPLLGVRGEAVVLVDRLDPNRSRMILADEA